MGFLSGILKEGFVEKYGLICKKNVFSFQYSMQENGIDLSRIAMKAR